MSINESKSKSLAIAIYELNKTLSPARQQAINDMLEGRTEDLPMQQMHYGGYCSFDSDLKIVELEGEFSKDDLLRIAASMR